MKFFDLFRKHSPSLIQWKENNSSVLSTRFSFSNFKTQLPLQLIVSANQIALLFKEGEFNDLFEIGEYQLQWCSNAEVYFFSTRTQMDQKWGTPVAITLRDKDLGIIRLRAHGSYSYKIKNPKIFFKKFSYVQDQLVVQDIEGTLRATLLTHLSSYFGQSQVHFIDMAAKQIDFSQMLLDKLSQPFSEFGLSLESFFVQSISLPEEIQSRVEQLSFGNKLSDLKKYVQFQKS